MTGRGARSKYINLHGYDFEIDDFLPERRNGYIKLKSGEWFNPDTGLLVSDPDQVIN